MPLHSKEIDRIAKVLARFFPDFGQRQSLASKAEVAAQAQIAGEVVEAWRDIVHCAHVEGTLDVLLRAASAERPQERELRRLVEMLEGEPKSETPRYLLVAVGLLAAGGVAFWMSNDAGVFSGELVAEEKGSPDEDGMAAVVDFPPGEEAGVFAAHSPEEMVASEPSTEDPVLPTGDAEQALEQVASMEVVSGRCSGRRGELVGYFYANNGISADVGEPYTMQRDVNVRTDYPRKENQWSSSQAVVCVLQRTDVVVLSSAPFKVDGGKVWVPLHAGDLQR